VIPNRVAIAGLGLVGASIAAALRRAGSHVNGYDPSGEACETARSLGHVEAASTDMDAELTGAELVVLAAPVPAIVRLIEPVAEAAPEAVIVDVGSVKGPIVAEMMRLDSAQRCIGGHPIAGKETSGATHADAALFDGRAFVLTPHERTDERTLASAKNLVNAVRGRLIDTTAEEHDRIVARTSHLPQILSSVLAANLLAGDVLYAGMGLHDMTRLALSDPELWSGILEGNGQNIASELRRVSAQLESVASRLQEENLSDIRVLMTTAQDAARELRAEAAA
jgi:prephenate dehydrogenase